MCQSISKATDSPTPSLPSGEGAEGDRLLTPAQLRTTALIFAEHEYLKRENALLTTQIAALTQTVTASDSMMNVYRAAVQQLETNHTAADRARDSIEASYREQIRQQQRKSRRRTVIGTAAGIAAGIVIGIVIKE